MKIARLGDSPELFQSLQGEGVSMGRPAVFLRLALCNLSCAWCDTPYTWQWSSGEKEKYMMEMSPREVAERISSFPLKHVIITGGEPLLQGDQLVELAEALPEYSFEIETNGTIIPPDALDKRVVQYNVSPKLSHSGNKPGHALRKEALTWFSRTPRAWFKFVVSEPGDVAEINVLEKEFLLPHDRILLMPCGTSPQEMDEIMPWLAEECIGRGYRLTDRMHIRLWGNKPGV